MADTSGCSEREERGEVVQASDLEATRKHLSSGRPRTHGGHHVSSLEREELLDHLSVLV